MLAQFLLLLLLLLRKGTIENPGFEKLRAGLPLALTSRMLAGFGIKPHY